MNECARSLVSFNAGNGWGILNEPPDTAENIGTGTDPLTPMDQKFATLKDLAEHYRIFINRIQTQLSTMGGGGAGFIKDLDDVEFDQTTGDNKLLIYDLLFHSSRFWTYLT